MMSVQSQFELQLEKCLGIHISHIDCIECFYSLSCDTTENQQENGAERIIIFNVSFPLRMRIID